MASFQCDIVFSIFCYMTNRAASWQNQQNGLCAQQRLRSARASASLIRVFTVCMKKAWFFSYSLRAKQRLWSDWADAQADLSVRWARHFCCTCFSMGDLGVQVLRPSVHPSTFTLGVLWAQLLLQFCTNLFETLHVFRHGMRMCMWFGYNCEIIFCHFFHFVNLVIFLPQCIDSGYLVSAAPHTILYRSFWDFAHVFSMVWRCACGLDIILALIFVTFSLRTLSFPDLRFYESIDSGYLVSTTPHTILYQSFRNFARFRHGLEVCMWFGYNPWINFCHFFHFVNFVIFWPQILWKCIDSGYHVSTTPYTTSCLSLFNFAHLFVHGLKMCIWFGFNPAVNFCHFSTLLTLSFFAGATSASPKFDLYWFCHEVAQLLKHSF